MTDINEAKDPKNSVSGSTLAFGSATIRQVCRSTLQGEIYSLQHGLEVGDKRRGVTAELKGQIPRRQKWEEDSRMCMPHLAITDCRSLADHLAAEIPTRVKDKRLDIELTAIHGNLCRDGQKTRTSMQNGGDCLVDLNCHYDLRLPYEVDEARFHAASAEGQFVQSPETSTAKPIGP